MIRISAVVLFSDKSSREDSLNMSYKESHSGQDNLRNCKLTIYEPIKNNKKKDNLRNFSQRSDMGNQKIQNDSKKSRNHIFAVYAISTFP